MCVRVSERERTRENEAKYKLGKPWCDDWTSQSYRESMRGKRRLETVEPSVWARYLRLDNLRQLGAGSVGDSQVSSHGRSLDGSGPCRVERVGSSVAAGRVGKRHSFGL